jgi:hypothetical protein
MDPWRKRGDSQIRSFFLLNPPPAGTCGSATGAASAWGISQSAKGPKNRPSYAARFTIWCCAWSPSSRSVGNKILQDLDSRGVRQSRSAEEGRAAIQNLSSGDLHCEMLVQHTSVMFSMMLRMSSSYGRITRHSIVHTTCIKSNTYAAVH